LRFARGLVWRAAIPSPLLFFCTERPGVVERSLDRRPLVTNILLVEVLGGLPKQAIQQREGA
jgi:hypothetical protein